jgi:hypothetical protein
VLEALGDLVGVDLVPLECRPHSVLFEQAVHEPACVVETTLAAESPVIDRPGCAAPALLQCSGIAEKGTDSNPSAIRNSAHCATFGIARFVSSVAVGQRATGGRTRLESLPPV